MPSIETVILWNAVIFALSVVLIRKLVLITGKNQVKSLDHARKVTFKADPEKVVVGIILFNDVDFEEEHVMVQLKKPRSVNHSIIYGPPGGGYEIDDRSLFDGACREFQEETGLDLLQFPDGTLVYEGFTLTNVIRNNGRIVYNFYLRVSKPNTIFQWTNTGIDMEDELMLDLPFNCCKGHIWKPTTYVLDSDDSKFVRMKNLLTIKRG